MSCYAGPYNRGIVTNGLVLYYDVNEPVCYSSGRTDIQDLSRNGNAGTLVNGVGYSANNGGSLVFDGVNDYVVCPANNIFNFGTNDMSINAWIYWDGTYINTGREIYATGGSGSLDQFGIFQGFGLYFGGVYNNISLNYPTTNQWSYVSASKIGNNIKLYVNGVESASGTQNSSIGSSSVSAYIGVRGSDNQHWFKGNISNMAIYKNKGLSASEIKQNFNAHKDRFGL